MSASTPPTPPSETVGIANPFRQAQPAQQEATAEYIGSDARLAYTEWVRQVALLPEWERGEIDKCVKILGDLVEKHEASAKLAIVGITLKIAISEGQ